MQNINWWSETATTIVTVIAASAAGRMLFVGYQLKDSERRIVIMWLFFEFFVAIVMGVLALGAVGVLEQVFNINLEGWPSFAMAATFGWLGPKGLQGAFTMMALRHGAKIRNKKE